MPDAYMNVCCRKFFVRLVTALINSWKDEMFPPVIRSDLSVRALCVLTHPVVNLTVVLPLGTYTKIFEMTILKTGVMSFP